MATYNNINDNNYSSDTTKCRIVHKQDKMSNLQNVEFHKRANFEGKTVKNF